MLPESTGSLWVTRSVRKLLTGVLAQLYSLFLTVLGDTKSMKAAILTLFLAGCGTLQLCIGTCDVVSTKGVDHEATQGFEREVKGDVLRERVQDAPQERAR